MRRFVFYFFIGSVTFTMGLFTSFISPNGEEKLPAAKIIGAEAAQLTNWQVADEAPHAKRFNCTNEIILAVLSNIKQNKESQETLEFFIDKNNAADCSEMFDIERKDLNRDGIEEFFVTTTEGNLCSARSDCPSWVINRKGAAYRVILDAGKVQNISDDKTYHQGYTDIETSRTAGGCCFRTAEYRYENGRYKAFRCTEWGWSETGYDKDRYLKPEECRAW